MEKTTLRYCDVVAISRCGIHLLLFIGVHIVCVHQKERQIGVTNVTPANSNYTTETSRRFFHKNSILNFLSDDVNSSLKQAI